MDTGRDTGTVGLAVGAVLLLATVPSSLEAQGQPLCTRWTCDDDGARGPNKAYSAGYSTYADTRQPCKSTGEFEWRERSRDRDRWRGHLRVTTDSGDEYTDSETVHDTPGYEDGGTKSLDPSGDPAVTETWASYERKSWFSRTTYAEYEDTDTGIC